MSWFPVDDAFHSHPKARKAGLEALGLWTVSGSYSMAYLTDGFVPEWFVQEKPKGAALAKRLVAAGLWRSAEKDGEQGFEFHDWKPECTKAHVTDVREKARQRKAKSRESQVESRRDTHVTGRVSPWVGQPNPTQPNPLLVETSSGGVTKVDANDPRPDCNEHAENYPGRCRKCEARRKWDEANAAAVEANELDQKRREREIAANCPICHGTNLIEIGDNRVRKCNHQEARNA